MSADIFYRTVLGRWGFQILQRLGGFRLCAAYLQSPLSKPLIAPYIRKNQIDMQPFQGQKYRSFGEFFARKRNEIAFDATPSVLISPCDSLLSIYPISGHGGIAMKGSFYRMADLIPDREIAKQYEGGLLLVFRLQASDYHHFCAFDTVVFHETHHIPGQLHSVQPIACETVPVYRLNRRWWSILDTEHFGRVVQIEVGAMAVGGVSFAKNGGFLHKGEEMGNFELAGSTIVLAFERSTTKRLRFCSQLQNARNGRCEVGVTMGQGIGVLTDE